MVYLKTLPLRVTVPVLGLFGSCYFFISHLFGCSNMACPVVFDTLPSFVVTALLGATCVVLLVRMFIRLDWLCDFLSWIGQCSIAFFLIEEFSIRIVVRFVRLVWPTAHAPVYAMPTTCETFPLKILIAVLTFGLSCLLMPLLMGGLNRCKSWFDAVAQKSAHRA